MIQQTSQLPFSARKTHAAKQLHGKFAYRPTEERKLIEMKQFGLDNLEGVKAFRRPKEWAVTLNPDFRIPQDIAKNLRKKWGEAMRPFGWKEISQKMFESLSETHNGVNVWVVSKPKALKDLVNALRSHLQVRK